ncbi:MAG: DPP IV N-terminal domain-containing protein [Anaerolineales bacterium]|nr:DPP IV N-terminal domain-containing protein [Anaerolineales bacterium]
MNKLRWLILVLLLAACGGAEEATAVPATIASSAPENAAAEVLPTATAVPPQPTNTRSPTVIPPTPQPPTRPATAVPPTATIRPTSTPIPADVPALVWLPYGTGNFGQPVLMLEAEAVAPQPMPVAVEIFFDYQAGWLAYGSHFWQPTASQQSVTDLHLYNFATGEDVVWAEQVGRAAVSPQQILDGPPPVAAAVHNGQTFDLILLRGAENRTVLVEDVQPYFSWSPDGRQIAYLRNNNLFITDAVGDSGNPPIASGVYQSSGWIGDAPLWLGDSGYLLYADAPFTIVAADGSGTIVPTAVDGNTLAAGRPFAMLYSATTNQLIAESEGMFGSSVAIYQLSDDFATAELVEQFEDAQLAGWYEADVSIILSISGEPTILPLTPQE